MSDCIWDPDVRLVARYRLRSWECGWHMEPARVERHRLVYRCARRRCGRHLAEIADVEAGLLRDYRQHLTGSSVTVWIRCDTMHLDAMYTALVTAWTRGGHVQPGFTAFRPA